MKKRLIPALLALLLAVTLLPAAVFAATPPTEADWKTPPVIADLKIDHDDTYVWLEVDIRTPDNVRNAIEYAREGDNWEEVGYISAMEMKVTIDGKEYEEYLDLNYSDTKNPEVSSEDFIGIYETVGLSDLRVDSEVKAQVRYRGVYPLEVSSDIRYSDWSNEVVLNAKADFHASDWAQAELAQAAQLGLIPESLKDADLTQPITRAEFAAVSVKVYEALSGEPVAVPAANPFTDTNDPEVLKAFGVGVTNGMSETTFVPNALLNREQAATMLTRVYKKVSIPGWTLETDGQAGALTYDKGAPFADDADISEWAKDSVYFMAANGIINGMGDNIFAPKATTPAQEAVGYAQATREQALLIAVRMVNNLG